MSSVDEINYEYRKDEYFYVDMEAIFHYCLPALVQEFIRLAISQFVINFIYRLFLTDYVLKEKPIIKHLLCSVLGITVLSYFYPVNSIIFLIFVLISIYLLFVQRKLTVIFVPVLSVVIFGCFQEWFELELRPMQGPIMILIMKLIWIWMEDGVEKKIDGLPIFLHYCLSPSSVVFGPIVPFDEFKTNIFSHGVSLNVFGILKVLVATFFGFIVSNCICQSIEILSPVIEQPFHLRFFKAYKEALEFRMSHYFVSYLSAYQMIIGTPKLFSPVTDFWAIEVPKSMREVVRKWNCPMHKFLKKYVFQKLRATFGSVIAIISTFIVSALLHMFEPRVTVVLVGLSLVCVIESQLEKHIPIRIAELWFRITTFVHLVFFGCIMMNQEEEEDISFYDFVMQKWISLNFISLKILIAECILCAVLEIKRIICKR